MKNKTFKKALAVFLVLCLLVLQIPVGAVATVAAYTPVNQAKAATLNTLGLLLGDATGNFNLGGSLIRADMSIMLVRLLGKVPDVEANTYSHPFADVKAQTGYATNYVGYLYTNNLVAGKPNNIYGTRDKTTYTEFIAVTLRALGYTEAALDFAFADAPTKAVEVGLLTAAELTAIKKTAAINRDYMALVAYNALFTRLKGESDKVLLDAIGSAVPAAKITAAAAKDTKVKSYQNGTLFGTVSLSASEIAAAVSPAVFRLEVFGTNGAMISSGSGFVVAATGKAVTCYHVIEGAATARAVFDNGKSYSITSVLGYSIANDTAVVQLGGATGLPVVATGDSDAVKTGDKVYAVGCALGFQTTLSEGMVTAAKNTYLGTTYIQTDAALSHGSSGGVLVNGRGQAIGITAGGLTNTTSQVINFAVPINVYKTLALTSNLTLAQVTALEATAAVPAPYELEVDEKEPNDVTPQALAVGTTLYGNMSSNSDKDKYSFTIKKAGMFVAIFMLDYNNIALTSNMSVQLLNSSGAVVANGFVEVESGLSYIGVAPTSYIAAGTYTISISCNSSSVSFTSGNEYLLYFMVE